MLQTINAVHVRFSSNHKILANGCPEPYITYTRCRIFLGNSVPALSSNVRGGLMTLREVFHIRSEAPIMLILAYCIPRVVHSAKT